MGEFGDEGSDERQEVGGGCGGGEDCDPEGEGDEDRGAGSGNATQMEEGGGSGEATRREEGGGVILSGSKAGVGEGEDIECNGLDDLEWTGELEGDAMVKWYEVGEDGELEPGLLRIMLVGDGEGLNVAFFSNMMSFTTTLMGLTIS